MKPNSIWKAAALALAWQAASPALAATVWDNGAPATVVTGGSVMTDTIQAEDFTLLTTTDLTGITFWDLQGVTGDYLGSINYQIYAGSPGGTLVASGSATPTRTAAGTVLGYSQFQNDFAVSITGLVAGTYWLALHDGPVASTSFADFYWSWADLNATNAPTTRGLELGLAPLATSWTTNEQEHAFLITGVSSVPELTPAAMLGLGLGAVFLAQRRRRQA